MTKHSVEELAKYRYILPTHEYLENRTPAEVLTIDDDVALWLMRMCVGEGGRKCSRAKAETMLWAIVHRWFLYPGRRHWKTFLFMVRRFSQPINPRWMAGGDLAKKFAGKPAGSPARLRRRARISSLPEEKIPKHIRDVVREFQRGQIPFWHDQRVTNWASLPSTPKKYPWGFDIDGDWFFEDRNLRDGTVFVLPMTPLVPIEG